MSAPVPDAVHHDVVDIHRAGDHRPLDGHLLVHCGGDLFATLAGELAGIGIAKMSVRPFALAGTVDRDPERGVGDIANFAFFFVSHSI